jgi:hypothetical protein
MHQRIRPIIAAALVLVVCRAAFDQAGAKVVRDDKGSPANPAIEAGGHHLPTSQSARFPYSLIGVIAGEDLRIGTCDIWPWRSFEAFSFHRLGAHRRMTVRRLDRAAFHRISPLVK